MVPRVAKRGRSFKGAGLYYLHDKKARTKDRVLFSLTINLPTQDPEKAMRWMAYTAMRQEDIKREAGSAMSGRKTQKSVYSYSLSWAPEETPTKEQMITAAFSSMEKLGLSQHEAVLIAHNDTPHPHVHVIANRVNPETGLAAPLSKDHVVLSQWAEAYELAQGQIRIERRVENNKERQRGRYMKDKNSEDVAEYRRWQKDRERAAAEQRKRQEQDLTETQKREREELDRKAKEEIDDIRKQQKAVQKADWSDLFRQQKKERDAFEEAQRSPFGRLRYWLKNQEIDKLGGDLDERGNKIQRAFQVLSDGNMMRDAIPAREIREKTELAVKLKALTEVKVNSITDRYAKLRDEMTERHSAQSHQQTVGHALSRDQQQRMAREGQDISNFEVERAAKEITQKKAPARAPAQSQQKDQEQRRDDDFTRFGRQEDSPTIDRKQGRSQSDDFNRFAKENVPSRSRGKNHTEDFSRFATGDASSIQPSQNPQSLSERSEQKPSQDAEEFSVFSKRDRDRGNDAEGKPSLERKRDRGGPGFED